MSNHTVLYLSLAVLGIHGGAIRAAGEPPPTASDSKPSLGAMLSAGQPGQSRSRPTAGKVTRAVNDGYTELLAVGFVVPAASCRYFDSELSYLGVRSIVVSILALNASIATTRVVPLFSVTAAPYMSATTQLRGADFAFSDGGGGSVPVGGQFLRLLVCNEGTDAVEYTQLTVYSPGAYLGD